ncbi:lipopolysaccharide biosynthesis protein [Neobacillus sp. SAB-20_R2A]|uniref:lipopolysaccharide biosynthesis protein n=1 Tax=Neobacillus sp. SAB-20_R2A TaxID=3120519 RepID=UPI003C6DF94C
MSRVKSLINNSLFSILQQIVVMSVGMILPQFMLRYYGSETNGLITSITQIIAYFALIEAGIAGAAVYSLYKPLAENSWSEVSGVVSAAKKTYFKLGWVFIGLTGVFAFIYPLYVITENLSKIEVGILVLVLGTAGALEFFTLAKYRVLLTASQRSFVISIATMIGTLTNAIIIITFSLFQVNIVLVKAIAVISLLLRSLILSIYTRRKFTKVNYKSKPNMQALSKRWDAGYVQILFSVQSGAPIIIATIFTSLEMVSVFSIYNMVFAALLSLMSVLVTGSYASIGDLIVRNKPEQLKKVYSELQTAFYCVIAVVYAITLVMINSFVKVYVSNLGDAYIYDRALLGILFVLSSLFQNLQTPQGILSTAAGMYKEVKVQSTIHSLIIIIGGCIGVYFFELEGILIVTLIANIYRFVYYTFFVPKYITKDNYRFTFWQLIKVLVIIGVIYYINILVDFEPINFIQWTIMASITGMGAIILTLLIAIFFERSNLKSILQRLKSTLLK